MKVLLIEDTEDMAGLIRDTLTELGHEFEHVFNGEELKKLLSKQSLSSFDFVLSDCNVPGYKFHGMLNLCNKANIPVLLQSNRIDNIYKNQMGKAYCPDELKKEIDNMMSSFKEVL